MSTHVEYVAASEANPRAVTRGAFLGSEEEGVTEPLALAFGFDSVAVIEGTREELVAILDRARAALDAIADPSEGTLPAMVRVFEDGQQTYRYIDPDRTGQGYWAVESTTYGPAFRPATRDPHAD